MASSSVLSMILEANGQQQPLGSGGNAIVMTSATTATFSSSSHAQKKITSLLQAVDKMNTTTSEACRCCEQLSKRSRHLDSLTSPASDASATLSTAASNLGSTLVKMKDARDKFETVRDCEPAIERLHAGVRELEDRRVKGHNKGGLHKQRGGLARGGGGVGGGGVGGRLNPFDDAAAGTMGGMLSEQDVYAAADSMEILRDAFDYFILRKNWRSTPTALQGIERVHKLGVASMCLMITSHLMTAGQAIRIKQSGPGSGGSRKDKGKDGSGKQPLIPSRTETAEETRDRLTRALQNRDLLKSIGEYEELQPMEARPIRELRSIFECLGGDGYHLGNPRKREPASLTAAFGVAANKVIRTEKVGSGSYTTLVKKALKTGFPQLDAYGEARRDVAFRAIDMYYRKIKAERKKTAAARKSLDDGVVGPSTSTSSMSGTGGSTAALLEGDEADIAARDAVKCLEHAMVTVAGEKNVYRAVVAPSLIQSPDEDAPQIPPFYRKACVAAYSYIVASVVDRTMDIIETVFLKEGGVGVSSGDKEGAKSGLSVRSAASAASAGLRMLDGVRMLGPSLAKLTDLPITEDAETGGKSKKNATPSGNMTVASTLCIAIHRTTVKNTAKTLENLARAIHEDPCNGSKHRPPDARISSVTSDVVRALRLISPFVSAYKSVTKRRALPWDPNIGEEAGDMDNYVKHLIAKCLLNSLKTKALNYTKTSEEGDEGGFAKSNMFMINNTYYLLKQLAPSKKERKRQQREQQKQNRENQDEDTGGSGERYQLTAKWFEEQIRAIFESEKEKYLSHWEAINMHLTSVDSAGLEYQKNKNLLSLDSGRLFKERFKGFNEDFERLYMIHHSLAVIDPQLRKEIQTAVKRVFLARYEKFYVKYSKVRFSKKNQQEYLRYPPPKVHQMLDALYGGGKTSALLRMGGGSSSSAAGGGVGGPPTAGVDGGGGEVTL